MIQSTVGDAMSVALNALHQYRQLNSKVKYKILLSIHDAVLLEVPVEHLKEVVYEVLPMCMTEVVEVPGIGLKYTLGEIDIQLRWGEKESPEVLLAHGVPEELCGFKK